MKGDRLVGLVDGLGDGPSTIVAERDGARAELEVVNHPISGPLFSGPHLDPFVCKTERFDLGPPTDDDCSAPTQTRTEDVGGVSATVERGVIDRSIYTIVFPESGWNGRLVYRFGGGCGTSYSQGSSFVNAVDPTLVSKGYAVVTSTASARFLEHAADLIAERGGTIDFIDLAIVCEAPKIGPHREAIRASIAAILRLDRDQVSVKATTTERLGFTGRGEGMAAQAIATVRVPNAKR